MEIKWDDVEESNRHRTRNAQYDRAVLRACLPRIGRLMSSPALLESVVPYYYWARTCVLGLRVSKHLSLDGSYGRNFASSRHQGSQE